MASLASRSLTRCRSIVFSPDTVNRAALSPCLSFHASVPTTGHGPSVGTLLGIGGCLDGRTFTAIIIPNGICCSMWQWNCQMPGKFAWNRKTAQLRCQIWKESLSSGALRFSVFLSSTGSYAHPKDPPGPCVIVVGPTAIFGRARIKLFWHENMLFCFCTIRSLRHSRPERAFHEVDVVCSWREIVERANCSGISGCPGRALFVPHLFFVCKAGVSGFSQPARRPSISSIIGHGRGSSVGFLYRGPFKPRAIVYDIGSAVVHFSGEVLFHHQDWSKAHLG